MKQLSEEVKIHGGEKAMTRVMDSGTGKRYLALC